MRSAPPPTPPEALAEPPHPAVGQRGVVIPRVELQRDEGHAGGDGGQQGLHRLVRADGHVLRAPGLEGHTVCGGRAESHTAAQHVVAESLTTFALDPCIRR